LAQSKLRAVSSAAVRASTLGLAVRLHVDIGHMADRSERQPGDNEQGIASRPSVLLGISRHGDVPALDDGERQRGALALRHSTVS